MTRHLSPDHLIDLAEGTRPESSAPHLESCEACRRQLADMRAMMSAASEVAVPEPSPLFWDHLSERVRQAVALEAAGDAFLAAADAPPSIAVASHLAGVALPPAASLFRISSRLVGDGEPRTVDQWRLLLVNSIRDVSPALTELALPRLPFSSTRIEPLFDAQVDTESRVAAAAARCSGVRDPRGTALAGLG